MNDKTTGRPLYMDAHSERMVSTGLIALNAGGGLVAFLHGVSDKSAVAVAGAIMLSTAAALATWRHLANGR